MSHFNTQLYLISPPQVDPITFCFLLEEVLKSGVISCFQLRLKDNDDKTIINLSNKILPICKKYNIPFILNDRVDLVKICNADGVHLGEEDGSIKKARKLLGSNSIIGASCYNSKHLAMEAAENGANYVAFGAFFKTNTKVSKASAHIEIIKDWLFISNIPCVAIGGITPLNCKELIEVGVDHMAVISSIWESKKSPIEAVKDFKNLLY